ncbi:MAG: squalene/phytoene synthase family protein [Bacteroidota bacterium]|nr:squalene/phytoene synthase family protein [Bacteroidota bacterium]
MNELGRIAQRFHIRETYFFDLIRGMFMDLERKRYRTFEELEQYCHYVASSVGLICGEIFGYRNPLTRRYAVDLGVALQLTNIMRDVRADAARGRIYIPQEDFERFGYTEDQLFRGTYNAAFAHLMHFEAERARAYFTRARETLPREDYRSFISARIMASVYFRILRIMEQRAYDVFTYRVKVSPFAAFVIAARECVRRPGLRNAAAP